MFRTSTRARGLRFVLSRRWAVETLEDRTTPANVGPLRPFSPTEVSAFIHSAQPLQTLSHWVQNEGILGIDLRASREIFHDDGHGNSLVSIGVTPGSDPLVVISGLEKASFVTWAEPNYIFAGGDPRDFTPNDPQYGSQYHHTKMQNNLAWDIETGETSIVVAVTDEGVGYNHPDLSANIWTNPGEIAADGKDNDGNGFIDDVRGWDFSSGDNNPLPVGADSHGTHVSGIISADTDNGVGVAGVAGGGNGKGGGVRIMPIRWDGSTGWTAQRVAESFAYAANNGAKIVNSSYNFDGFADNATVIAGWDYSYGKGVLHFNSAGNNNTLNPARRSFTYPIFVGATDSADKRASYSNYGTYVDVSAPGSGILSTTTSADGTGVSYSVYDGTSMATPNAAGVAALIWSANPSWTREQVVARLLATADPIDSLNSGFEGKLGTGRVNSYKALTVSNSAPKFGTNTLPAEGSTVSTFPTIWTIVAPNRFSPATVVSGNFELRRDGPDGIFNTADDVTYPLTINAGAPYRVGTNELTFTYTGTPTPDRYRFRAVSGGLRDPFNNPLDGNGDGTGGDSFDRTFTLSGTSGVIYGTVFEDRNNDGIYGAGETPLSGWTVYVDANNDGALTSGELSTTTNASGLYALSGVPAGTSTIRRITATGWNDGTPAAQAVTLAGSDSVVNGRDFGQFQEGSIYGLVFSDVSNDGRRTGGETGLSGWTGYLDLSNNGVFDTGTTGNSADVPKAIGDFTTVSSNLTISGFVGNIFDVNIQLDITHTYDADLDIFLYGPGGQKVELTTDNGFSVANFTNTVFDDQALVSITAGTAPYTGSFRPEGLLSTFNGLSPNGTWKLEITDDAGGDSGTLNSWKIILNADPSVTTDAAGTFRIPILPGTYNVRRVVQPGWISTSPAGDVHTVSFAAGNHVAGLAFGQRSNTNLTGSVYVDNNASGSFGFGEPGIAGRTVYLDANGNKVRDTGSGSFTSTDVPLGIRDFLTTDSFQAVAGLAGLITDVNVTVDLSHTSDSNLSLFLVAPDGTRVELSTGNGGSSDNYTNTTFDDQAATAITAGIAPFTGNFRPEGLLSDFNGASANGVWQLEVYDDGASDTGVLNSWSLSIDTAELTTVTAAGGNYSFPNQTPGAYALRTELPFGWVGSEPVGGTHSASIIAGGSYFRNFGQYQPVNISGRVYNDLNGSYRLDGGEPGVAGATVFLDTNNDGAINSATTTFNSADVPKTIADDSTVVSTLTVTGFSGVITDINVKLYITHTWDADLDVFLRSPSGQLVELTTDNGGGSDNYTDTVFDDEAATGIAAGVAPFTGSFRPEGLLSDFDLSVANGLWTLEVTDDAFQDVGTLNSWSLTISGGEAITTTDASGNYQFGNLPPGRFTVRQILAGGTTQTQPGGTGGGHVVVATSGTTTIDRNLGQYVPSSIAGNVYVDANRNYSKDGTELGQSGTIVYLDGNNNGVRDTAAAQTFTSTNVPLDILDGGTTLSKVSVTGLSGVVYDVNVKLNVNHTYDSDLQIVLISPAGQRIALATNNGSSGDNFTDTVFDDEAGTAIAAGFAPFSGSYRPVGLLSAADGFDPNGDWYLEVTDTAAIDVGTLNSWSVTIGTGELFTSSDASGDYKFTLGAGSYTVREVTPTGYGMTEPSIGFYFDGLVASLNVTGRNFGVFPQAVITGAVYNDANYSFTREGGETGLANVTVYNDANGNGALDVTTQTFTATTVPVTIDGSKIHTSTLNVAGLSGVVADVNVKINISHTWDADVNAVLISPVGTRIALTLGRGGSSDNFTDTVFDDEAGISIAAGVAPFSGSFRPEVPLSLLDGLGGNGTWTLEITDTYPPADNGILNSWSLTIQSGEQFTTSDAIGNYSFTGLAGGTYRVRQITPVGYTPTEPAPGPTIVNIAPGFTTAGINFGNFRAATIAGTVYADGNANGTFDGEPGIANVNVYFDDNNNGKLDQTLISPVSVDVPIPTMDNTTVTSKLVVSGFSGRLSDADVKVNLNHAYDGALNIFLVAPTGQRVELSTNNGGGGQNYINTVFDDEATTAITSGSAPFTGVFRPEGKLSDLDNIDPNGTWFLEVTDTDGFGDIGAINGWSMQLTGGERSVVTDPAGKYSFSNLLPGTYRVRAETPSGKSQSEPSGGAPYLLTVAAGDSLTGKNFGFANPAKVATGGVVINGGSTQRSRVTTMTITFNQNIGTPPASAFTLQNQTTLLQPTVAASVDNSGPATVVTLTFAGNSTDFGSLADGRYTLTINASQINGGIFDGNGDGTVGDDYTMVGTPANTLFRLYGDADGNGQVTSSDFLAFRLAFLSTSTAFDFNNSGSVDSSDFLAFRLRFLQSV
ncbi:MAG: proprotein convertase P-domain-containing protein [Gemmataceae bacterium]|nr:proprotein convertase P-domain-containing protein [Gemmataceae bacterium]